MIKLAPKYRIYIYGSITPGYHPLLSPSYPLLLAKKEVTAPCSLPKCSYHFLIIKKNLLLEEVLGPAWAVQYMYD